ncbi:MAG TPA: hypothetical protein VFO94_04595, partial [Gammaproteobacteria bacterium]|nr:hypothetical protein [Gammaproteobacteria bacterium]
MALFGASALVAPAAQAELYYLIVGGIGGEQKYQEQFDKEVASLASVARKTTGDARVTVLQGDKATREAVEKSFASLARKVKPTDSLAVFLVGHGSYDGEIYKFN